MKGTHWAGMWRIGFVVVCWSVGMAFGRAAPPGDLGSPQAQPRADQEEKLGPPTPTEKQRRKRFPEDPRAIAEINASLPQPAPSILPKDANAVDLGCVLRLAGVENPDILIARARVAGAEAIRMFYFAQILPNLNAGVNYDAHTGPLQQSSGNILKVNRNALYLGLGAGAIAAGTANIPGIFYTVNVSEGIFNFLAIRQTVRVRQFESLAVRNQIFLQVADAYMELLRAEGRRAVALKNQEEAHEIARLTASYLRTGEGNKPDADRAAAELARRNDLLVEAEREMLVASARLAQLINVPPSFQLHAIDGWVIPTPIVPDPIPLRELLFIAMNQRPELAARRAAIREATLLLRNQQLLPFSPTVIAGYSAGTYGGGSNIVSQPGGFQGFFEPRFDSFAPRDDVDVLMVWTAQNMGVGNLARIRGRRVDQQIAQLELVRELNRVRDEVARAYAGTHARFAQIRIAQTGVQAGLDAYREDLNRIRTIERALPIELLNSFQLLAQARYDWLDAVVDYDKAQFGLYVALGQPPARYLAREIPADLVPPPAPAPPLPGCAPDKGADPGACAACRTSP